MTPALEARALVRDYLVSRGAFRPPATVKALAGVSFALETGAIRVPRPAAGMMTKTFMAGCKYTSAKAANSNDSLTC